jgi:hypothetical protein
MMLAAQRNLFTGSFNPLSLSPALWLSDTGSNPAQWDDLSGNGRHATQGTAANQPVIVANALNGRQVRRFDGSNDSLVFPSGFMPINDSARTVYVVGKQRISTSGLRSLFCYGGTTDLSRWNIRFNTNELNIECANRLASGGAVANPTDFHILGCLHSGGSLSAGASMFIDGQIRSLSFSGAATGLLVTTDTNQGIGFRRAVPDSFFNGDIAEILVFQSILSTENRRRIEGYLSSKYNIAIS